MDDVFYRAGRAAAKGLRRARWIWNSLAGSESEALEAEYQVGADLARALDAESEWDADPAANELLAGISARLGPIRKERRWRVRLLRSDEPGAFALPGGFLYVTGPLVELCGGDPDEIACVVGHEMGHVVEGHALERVSNEIVFSGIRKAAGFSKSALLRWMLSAATDLMRSTYSQDQELGADAFGARVAHSAGYDPRGSIRVLERLRPLEAGGGGELALYFASHPPLAERIAALRRLIRVRPG
jgi:Zn-dependent protease with chaperone function